MTNEQLNRIVMNYGIHQPVITFLRHNENRTYQIEDAEGFLYLLRIHQPVKESMVGLQHAYEGLLGELLMLEEMGTNSTLVVQTPLRTLSGDLITTIDYEEKRLHCSVLTWLEGRDLNKDDVNDPALVKKLGSRIADLHSFFKGYSPYDGDKRPNQGIAYNKQLVQAIYRGYKMSLFNITDVHTIEKTVDLINSCLEDQENYAASWGLIHGDLGFGNILVTPEGELCFIDFGFFGPGYYLSDVAMGVSMIPEQNKNSFMEGYYGNVEVSVADIVLIEGLILISIIGYCAFQMDNESVHYWMRERVPTLCANHCIPFLAGERIFYKL